MQYCYVPFDRLNDDTKALIAFLVDAGAIKVEYPDGMAKVMVGDAPTRVAREPRPDNPALPDCPHEKLLELFHSILPDNPETQVYNDQRRSLTRQRWVQASKPGFLKGHKGYSTEEEGLDFWRRYFTYCSKSPFLTGKSEPSQGRPVFFATFEWLMRPSNFAKIIDGQYHKEVK